MQISINTTANFIIYNELIESFPVLSILGGQRQLPDWFAFHFPPPPPPVLTQYALLGNIRFHTIISLLLVFLRTWKDQWKPNITCTTRDPHC